MGTVGIVELAVGVTILAGWTRIGAYVASAWLLGVAANLVAAGFYDVAVRDVVMSLAAFTLARLAEVREEALRTGSLYQRRERQSPGYLARDRDNRQVSGTIAGTIPFPQLVVGRMKAAVC